MYLCYKHDGGKKCCLNAAWLMFINFNGVTLNSANMNTSQGLYRYLGGSAVVHHKEVQWKLMPYSDGFSEKARYIIQNNQVLS